VCKIYSAYGCEGCGEELLLEASEEVARMVHQTWRTDLGQYLLTVRTDFAASHFAIENSFPQTLGHLVGQKNGPLSSLFAGDKAQAS
jgi:TPP-dependent indolepyruvate ferredoxin oxidoreductase alpha subunit